MAAQLGSSVAFAVHGGTTGQLSGIWLGLWASSSGGAAQSASMFISSEVPPASPLLRDGTSGHMFERMCMCASKLLQGPVVLTFSVARDCLDLGFKPQDLVQGACVRSVYVCLITWVSAL